MTLFQTVRSRPRLFLSAALGVGIFVLLPRGLALQTRGIIAWDAGVAVFLTTALRMMLSASIERMRLRAAQQDAGSWAVLVVTVAAVCFSMSAIGFELHDAKAQPAGPAGFGLGLAAATIFLSWGFTHTMFALHYAHEFYRAARPSGLIFPGDSPPDYADFLYYAFVVGMTCQVSDVQVAGRGLRRLTLCHGVLSFVFNTVILALAINIAAGLF